MTENVTSWEQPDPFETSERFNVRGSADTPHRITNLTTPLSLDDYIEVWGLALQDRNGILGEDAADPQRAWGIESESWLTSPATFPADYTTMVREGLGGSHICNWDPFDWAQALETAAFDAFFADPPSDLADGPISIEWEGYSFGPVSLVSDLQPYFGTFTDRVLRVTSPTILGTMVDERGGAPIPWEPLPSMLTAIPFGGVPETGDPPLPDGFWTPAVRDTGVYGWGYTLSGGAAGWNTSEFDAFAGVLTIREAGGGELLATSILDEVEIPISDSLWESLKWPVGRFLFTGGAGHVQVTNEGVPLMIGSPDMRAPLPPWDYPEIDEIGVRGATVWLDGLYTPPRWRIRYTSSGLPVTRQWPRRADGRGLTAATSSEPTPKAGRIVGGEQ